MADWVEKGLQACLKHMRAADPPPSEAILKAYLQLLEMHDRPSIQKLEDIEKRIQHLGLTTEINSAATAARTPGIKELQNFLRSQKLGGRQANQQAAP